ncbi:MAG: hypothetical protein HY559_06300 [Gammaproteobacteria bacterium]|nr:hypothetical protein [Gammaproteobacteria bacterium]
MTFQIKSACCFLSVLIVFFSSFLTAQTTKHSKVIVPFETFDSCPLEPDLFNSKKSYPLSEYEEYIPYNSFKIGEEALNEFPFVKPVKQKGYAIIPIFEKVQQHLREGDILIYYRLVGKPAGNNLEDHLKQGAWHAAIVLKDERGIFFHLDSAPWMSSYRFEPPFHIIRLRKGFYNESGKSYSEIIRDIKKYASLIKRRYSYDNALNTDIYFKGRDEILMGKPFAVKGQALLGGKGTRVERQPVQKTLPPFETICKRGCEIMSDEIYQNPSLCYELYCSELPFTILGLSGVAMLQPTSMSGLLARVEKEVLAGLSEEDKKSLRKQFITHFFSDESVRRAYPSEAEYNRAKRDMESYLMLPSFLQKTIDQNRGPIYFPHDFVRAATHKNSASQNALCYAGSFVGKTLENFEVGGPISSNLILSIPVSRLGVDNVQFSPDGQWVAATSFSEGKFELYDATTGEKLYSQLMRMENEFPLQFTQDSQFILVPSIEGARLLEAKTGRTKHTFSVEPGQKVKTALFSPDDTAVFIADSKKVQIYDLTTGELIKIFERQSDSEPLEIIKISVVAPSQLVVFKLNEQEIDELIERGEDDETFFEHFKFRTERYNWKTGQFLSQAPFLLGFSSDGKYSVRLINGEDFSFSVEVHETGLQQLIFQGKSTFHMDFFSPNSRFFVLGLGSDILKILDLHTHNLVSLEGTHLGSIEFINFSPDSKHVVVISSGTGRVRVFSLHHPEIAPKEFSGHTDEITSSSFSPNGQVLVTASDDGSIKFWAMESLRALILDYLKNVTEGAYTRKVDKPDTLNALYKSFRVLATAAKERSAVTSETLAGMVQNTVTQNAPREALLGIVREIYGE